MSLINISNLTFGYTKQALVFDNVSFQIDTDWKLGLIGRNGKGKTTFLKLLTREYEYTGKIEASVTFDYFPMELKDTELSSLEVVRGIIAPFSCWENEMQRLLEEGTDQSLSDYGEISERYAENDGYIIDELIEKELSKLDVDLDVLARPFITLSSGEKLKLQLAGLFLRKNHYILFDEPFSHLDAEGRALVANYLKSKKGFILVSHERDMLDEVVDHILSINRSQIEIQKGSYSSWQLNKENRDRFELDENEKLGKDIQRLQTAMRRTAQWSDAVEKTKIGNGRIDRGYIGHKSAKMMARAKAIENRQEKAIVEKSALLKDVEKKFDIELKPVEYWKDQLLFAENLSVVYEGKEVFTPVTFNVRKGERVAVTGKNGSGKSSILKLICGEAIPFSGKLQIGSQLILSPVPQDVIFHCENLKEYAQIEGVDEALMKSMLNKLDFDKSLFEADLNQLSAGQKKKIAVAKSLSQNAHLYVWDEPLNAIDILSRQQIEELILRHKPTMIFVEHDRYFTEKIATKIIRLET